MDKINGIRAISFDGDGTLWDFEKVMRHSLEKVLSELKSIDAQAAELLDVEKMIEIRNRVASELKGRITNLETIRLEAFKQTLQNVGKPNDVLASYLNQTYLKHRFEDIELFSDVLPTLTALRRRYIIGLLSNGNNYPERCGLEDLFQFVVFSQDYGIEKPNAGIFNIALEKAGCLKRQLLHIGDSLQDDVVGADNAGIKNIWLNRRKIKNSPGFKTNYEIQSLSELLKIL